MRTENLVMMKGQRHSTCFFHPKSFNIRFLVLLSLQLTLRLTRKHAHRVRLALWHDLVSHLQKYGSQNEHTF
jgi:hypothetical protein